MPMAPETRGPAGVPLSHGGSALGPAASPPASEAADAPTSKAPFGSGRVWTVRSVSAVIVCGLFALVSVLCAFGSSGDTATWPLGLRMLYFWPFGLLFFGGAACLWMGDSLFAKLFARFGLTTRARKRLAGWGLIVASSLILTAVVGLAESLGYPTSRG